FREDLYYRLNVFPIHIPPLRERKTDIMLLANFFAEKYSKIHNKPIERISPQALDVLVNYKWPGNVRELENYIERAVLLSKDEVIHVYHLPPSLQPYKLNAKESSTLQAILDNVERELILDTLHSTRGNMAKSSRILGITERLMGLRVKKHAIDIKQFRSNS
ncbi:sigma-54-dependent Fis family transcriptional regulator, partial [bacterium]|nr:sigma-54-dependent Fis family transcriptional regulator [bacterium]